MKPALKILLLISLVRLSIGAAASPAVHDANRQSTSPTRALSKAAVNGADATAIADAARQAVARYMTALDAADKDTLHDAIYCDFNVAAQRQGVIAIVDCIVFQRALEREMAKRWGQDAVRTMVSRTTFTPADHASIKTARVELRENGEALVTPSPQYSPIVVRLSPDGRWRVVLRIVRALYDSVAIDHFSDRTPERVPEPGSQKQIDHLRGVSLTLRRTAQAVINGKFETPMAARAALQQALDAAALNPPVYNKAQDGPEE